MKEKASSYRFQELAKRGLLLPATERALTERAFAEDPPRQFFSEEELGWLTSALTILLPAKAPPSPDSLALRIDARLAAGRGDGWRFDALPADGDAYRIGLAWLAERAERDGWDAAILAARNSPEDAEFRADLFFEELLAEALELYYTHPAAQDRIGYIGYADRAGWKGLQIGMSEPWEVDAEAPVLPTPLTPSLIDREAMRRYPEDEPVDIVVIGLGAGGSPLLWRFAAAGLKVVGLDAGPWWDPTAQWATDEKAQEPLFWTDERLSAGKDPLAFGMNNSGTGVGGSTLHFTAYTPRPHQDDFQLRTDFGVGEDWPFGYEELAPYYDEVERTIGVSGPADYPWGPPREYPLPPLPVHAPGEICRRGANAVGVKMIPAANAALSAPYFQPGIGWRPACTNRGFCQAGCTVGAKASTDVTYIPLAVGAGAEIRPGCYVTRLEKGSDGRIAAVHYSQAGREVRQPCVHVYICAGAIETPRLLLQQGLANSSGEVGRNLMAHVGLQLWAQFDEEMNPWKGIPGALISEETYRPPDADFASGYLLQSLGVMPMTYAVQIARGEGPWGHGLYGPELGRHMERYRHVAGINICGEGLPYEHNRLELSGERDARGKPKPRITFTAGENEHRMERHADRLMTRIFEAAGGTQFWRLRRYAHVIGTCRMGDDPKRSVIDSDGRSHDIPNLSIMDHSIFPSSMMANPALTIMSLSLRCADRHLKRLGVAG